jgi:anti-sigma factor RsiW
MNQLALNDTELHAYVDGQLPEPRRAEVEFYLATHAEDAARVAAWCEQNRALHACFDAVLDEPLPERLLSVRRRFTLRPVLRYAAVIGWLAVGGAAGWYVHGLEMARPADTVAFVRQAAIAHAVYSPEVRHPVEVGADQEAHLVAWLSKRLGASLKVPQLNSAGYQLVGGRLLPGNQGPAAQFMFQAASGQRLTLYVRVAATSASETAFRYAQERGVSVFYWLDGRFGYALSGEVEKRELLRVANAVYQQLNP